MRKPNPLLARMKTLKKNGRPIIVNTAKERLDAHRFAGQLGIEIETQGTKFGKPGFLVGRIK
jgi:hypothetical protein